MELIIKKFYELSLDELFDIYELRSEVFVVEQNCVYQDIGEEDKLAYHVFFKENGKIASYCRVFMKYPDTNTAIIGRVISRGNMRGRGVGLMVVKEGRKIAFDRLNARKIVIHAQLYAKGFYEKAGFSVSSDEFMEDGIPHVEMSLEK